MQKSERRALRLRALAVGLPETASLQEVEAAEKAKGITPKAEEKKTVTSNEKEEDTGKIFNLSNGSSSDKTTTNKKVITDPVKAWGKPR